LTGVLGTVAAAQRHQGGWQSLLIGCTLDPLVGLDLVRKSPDAFIVSTTTATFLVALACLI
jgi:hypothetical protein